MRRITLALAALLGLMSSSAQADLQLQFANTLNAVVQFSGTGGVGTRTGTVEFVDGPLGYDFRITNSSSAGQSAVNLLGNIDGTFTYLANPLDTTVALTTVGPLPNFSIDDAVVMPTTLTADVLGITISQLGSGGSINTFASINLSNVSYTGSNADLIQLRDEANANGGIATISYQFTSVMTLYGLADTGPVSNSYSGTIATTSAVIPEPSTLAAAFTALPLLGGVYLLRRRARVSA